MARPNLFPLIPSLRSALSVSNPRANRHPLKTIGNHKLTYKPTSTARQARQTGRPSEPALFQAVFLQEVKQFDKRNGFAFRLVVDEKQIDVRFLHGHHHGERDTPRPPLFPRPFEVMAIRILRRPPPKSVPRRGWARMSSPSFLISSFSEGYRFPNRLASFSKDFWTLSL